MEILARGDCAKVEEVTGRIITSSGLTATMKEEGLVITEDGTYVWDPTRQDGGPHIGGGVRTSPLNANRSTGRCSSGQATPAGQKGSVLRKLYFH